MQRAPLIAPAIALVAGILAEQHGCATIGIAVACLVGSVAGTRRLNVTIAAAAAIAGIAVSHGYGHPHIFDTEQPTARYTVARGWRRARQ